MTTLLLATRNTHKVSEIRSILGTQFELLTLNDFPGTPKIVEDADTFAGNATKKSAELARWISENSKFKTQNSKLDFVLADDSGLEVVALNGAPGIHSARFAVMDSGKNENSSDAENNSKLLRLLENIPSEKRGAWFRCVLALTPIPEKEIESASPVCFADESELQTQLFDGVCEGKIIFEPRGKNGFGYDPLFVPDGFEKTFAELGEETKNKSSHRAKALAKLRDYLSKLSS
ncbi:MAG: non-canonical purine NTP pyrophosphatase [Limisphaerales bacterium]